MSFIANTAFEVRNSNGRYELQDNISGLYQANSANADCSAGILCVRNGKVPCAGMPTGVNNENTYYMNAASASTDANDVVYAANTYDAPFATIANGSLVHIGTETLNEGIHAGREGNFTKIHFDGASRYRFGEGNFTGAVGANGYATIGANGQLVPAASAPSANGKLYFVVDGTGSFTTGNVAGCAYYDLVACTVVA